MSAFTLKKYVFGGYRYLRERPKGWLNVLVNQFFASLNIPYAPMLPVAVTIEPTNVCNLQCEVCETGAGLLKRKKGRMNLENFQRIIDKIYSHTSQLLLYYMGESFLNPYIYDMIKYARKHEMWVELCTNGDLVDPVKLADADPNMVAFNLGGLTQETHEAYRGGGNLKNTLENIRQTLEERETRNGQMKITLGLIVMKHNEREVQNLPIMAEELGVDGYNLMSPCVRNYEQGLKFLPNSEKWWLYDQKIFEQKKLVVPKFSKPCHWLWHSSVVLWNGDLVPCCRDTEGEYTMGNLLKQDLKEIWGSKKYVDFRRMVARNRRNVEICRLCEGYGPPTLYKLA